MAQPAATAPVVALDALGADRGIEPILEGARLASADGIGLRVFARPADLAAFEPIAGVEAVAASEEITNEDWFDIARRLRGAYERLRAGIGG